MERREANKATKWLLVNKGAAIRMLEEECKVQRVKVNGNKVTLAGSQQAVADATQWLLKHRASQDVAVTEDQMRWLLGRRGAAIRDMEHASGLLAVDADREQGVVTLHGNASCADLAQRWLESHTESLQVPVSTMQVKWLRSARSIKLEQLQQATGVTCLDFPRGEDEEPVLKMMGTGSQLEAAQGWLGAQLPQQENGEVVEVQVDPELVGMILGKKGASLEALKQQTGVHEIDIDKEHGLICLVGSQASSPPASLPPTSPGMASSSW